MFERFTDRARRIVVLAQDEARMIKHNYIGTEHLLLGMLHEGQGVAAKALEAHGVSLEAARKQVEEIIGYGQHEPAGHIPYTPRVKKVLALALNESQELGHKYIGTEHLLLGLIRHEGGVAKQILDVMNVSLDDLRGFVLNYLEQFRGKDEKESPNLRAIADRLESIAQRTGELSEHVEQAAQLSITVPKGQSRDRAHQVLRAFLRAHGVAAVSEGALDLLLDDLQGKELAA